MFFLSLFYLLSTIEASGTIQITNNGIVTTKINLFGKSRTVNAFGDFYEMDCYTKQGLWQKMLGYELVVLRIDKKQIFHISSEYYFYKVKPEDAEQFIQDIQNYLTSIKSNQ